MNWKKIIAALFFSFTAISSIFSFAVFSNNKQINNSEEVVIEIIGHVKNPGKYPVAKLTSLGEIIKKAQPLFGAQLDNLNLDLKVNENQSFIIGSNAKSTFKNNSKIKWSQIQSVQDFQDRKISKRIAQILWNLREKNQKVTWSQIASISGIGKITLEKLKNLLILD